MIFVQTNWFGMQHGSIKFESTSDLDEIFIISLCIQAETPYCIQFSFVALFGTQKKKEKRISQEFRMLTLQEHYLFYCRDLWTLYVSIVWIQVWGHCQWLCVLLQLTSLEMFRPHLLLEFSRFAFFDCAYENVGDWYFVETLGTRNFPFTGIKCGYYWCQFRVL